MVWGCFAAHGVGHFRRIEGIMNQHVYREIITNHLQPSAQQLFPGGNYLFQQDNDPKHKARTAMTYLTEKICLKSLIGHLKALISTVLKNCGQFWTEISKTAIQIMKGNCSSNS
jgi:hypothetical protein